MKYGEAVESLFQEYESIFGSYFYQRLFRQAKECGISYLMAIRKRY